MSLLPDENFRKDFLTGFLTRESLVLTVTQLTENYQIYKKAFSILLIDIDFFKTFNDKYGHLLGDEVIKYFSSTINLDLVTVQTSLFRFGGDEFLVVFHAADSNEAYRLATRLLTNMKGRPCNLRGNQVAMSFSGGIASYPDDGKSVGELLECADKALYISKRYGRCQVTQYKKIWLKKLLIAAKVCAVFMLFFLMATLVRMNFQDKIYQWIYQGISVEEKIKARFLKRIEDVKKGWADTFEAARHGADMSLISLDGGSGSKPLPKATVNTESSFIRPIPATPVVVPRSKAVEKLDKIHLKSGGIVRGFILSENEQGTVKVALNVQAGKGAITLKKDEIEKIERAVTE